MIGAWDWCAARDIDINIDGAGTTGAIVPPENVKEGLRWLQNPVPLMGATRDSENRSRRSNSVSRALIYAAVHHLVVAGKVEQVIAEVRPINAYGGIVLQSDRDRGKDPTPELCGELGERLSLWSLLRCRVREYSQCKEAKTEIRHY